jgi:aminoglycoside phosphotransferase
VLTPDPGVPQRDSMLDEATVARVIGETVERRYAKYRVGESLRVVYRVGRRHVAGRSYRDGASAAAYERALAAAVPSGSLPPVIHAPDLDAVFWTFPNDRRIAALPLLAPGSTGLAELLGRPCPGTRVVAYAAERAAAAECLDERGRVLAYVKVHAGDGAVRERRALEAFAGPRVPRVLAAADSAVALEPVAGRRLDTLRGRDLETALRALGAALASLHRSPRRAQPRFTRLDVDRLARAVAVIARARPDAGRPAALLLAALLERRPCGVPDVSLHGDVNLRNAFLDGDRVRLVDLEDAASGPPAADLGQLLAGLLAARVLGRISASTERTLAAALLDGYGPVDRETLRWHTRASVLARVALPAVNRVRVPALHRLVPLLHEALA